jgi:hypothetical protein
MLGVIMLSAVMLNVDMLSAVVPVDGIMTEGPFKAHYVSWLCFILTYHLE